MLLFAQRNNIFLVRITTVWMLIIIKHQWIVGDKIASADHAFGQCELLTKLLEHGTKMRLQELKYQVDSGLKLKRTGRPLNPVFRYLAETDDSYVLNRTERNKCATNRRCPFHSKIYDFCQGAFPRSLTPSRPRIRGVAPHVQLRDDCCQPEIFHAGQGLPSSTPCWNSLSVALHIVQRKVPCLIRPDRLHKIRMPRGAGAS